MRENVADFEVNAPPEVLTLRDAAARSGAPDPDLLVWPTPPPASVMVELRRLRKSFSDHQVLSGINLRVFKGEVAAIIGPSGSGKSTILRCVNYLERPDDGEVWVGGRLVGKVERSNGLVNASESNLRHHRAETGIVFQQWNLFPHMSVEENITYAPIVVRGLPRATAVERADALLDKVGLLHKSKAYPGQLSGGEQQRVAIARALAMEPKVMLFDEVTSALDPELVSEVLEVLRVLANEGMTMILVTHEMSFALEVADHLLFIDHGSVVEAGAPKQVLTSPTNPRTRAFLQRFGVRP